MTVPSQGVPIARVLLSDLSHHYGRRKVLRRVSFSLGGGEVVGLLGPNGSGKSTLISILAGLIRPSSGDVRIEPASAREPKEFRRALGYLGHELALYPELTARENLRFFGRLHGLDDLEARIDAALVRARLDERGGDLVGGFSRGMRQRLALERALLHEPKLILLDEPFTGLDDRGVGLLVARLERLAAEGALLLLTTHDLDVAESLLTRVLVLHRGRVSELDARAGLRASYRGHVDDTFEDQE